MMQNQFDFVKDGEHLCGYKWYRFLTSRAENMARHQKRCFDKSVARVPRKGVEDRNLKLDPVMSFLFAIR